MSLTERYLIDVFNYFIKGTVVMATLEELQAEAVANRALVEAQTTELAAIKSSVSSINTILDTVAVLMATLKSQQLTPEAQAQMDAISETLGQIRVIAQSNVAEAQAIAAEAVAVVAETEALKA